MSLVSVPTAGSAVLVSAPVPNPVNYSFASGSVAASAQVNSDLYQLWNFFSTLTGQLNGATYCPAPAFSSIVVPTAAITASAGAATAGSGTQLTLALAHGTDFVDTSTAQTVAGNKTLSGTIVHTGAVQFNNVGVNGVAITANADPTNAILVASNAANTKSLFRVDDVDANNGNAQVSRLGTLVPLLPAMSPSGAALAASVKCVVGSYNVSVTAGAGNTVVTLSGAAVFSSASSYIVLVMQTQTPPAANTVNAYYVSYQSGSQFTIGYSSNQATSGTVPVQIFAIGT